MSNVELRPVVAGEMAEFTRIAAVSLAMDESALAGMLPEWTLCAFVDGQLATTHAAWPLTMRFNGTPASLSGVTMVTTRPVHRRQGLLRRVVTEHFRRMHESGEQAIAGLYAAQAAMYQRYGYGVTGTHHAYRLAPRDLVFATEQVVPGVLREVSIEDEFGLLVDVYRRYREHRHGLVHRGRAMWDAGVLAPAGRDEAQHIVAYEEDGEPLGYAIYITGHGDFGDPAGDQRLEITELAALTPAAHRALWAHFASFDVVHEITVPRAASDEPLPHLLREPGLLRSQAREGVLMRIVSVADALVARPYPEEAELRFRLVDALCPWNEGEWSLETAAEGSVAHRLDGASPHLTLDPATLAMVLFGHITATQAARMGRIDVHDHDALPRWDAAMRTAYAPFSAEVRW